ncbi:hypothetical protein BGW41_007527 [Actinomortierella wolfii]|nr:hypothetical protein BGW41_007527 [Actinomortierella wolfii]
MRNGSPSSLYSLKVVWALVAGMIACSTCASALPTLLHSTGSHHLLKDSIKLSHGPAIVSSNIAVSGQRFVTTADDEAENDDDNTGIDNGDEGLRQMMLSNYQGMVKLHDDKALARNHHHYHRTKHNHRYALQRTSILDDPITAQEQVLHQCTTHFAALLQSEVSDHLLVQLSRFVMMLPVLGNDIKTMLADEVEGIMDQILQGLVRYENVHRVIKMAVDDSGLLLLGGRGSASGNNNNNNPSYISKSRSALAASNPSSSSSLENLGEVERGDSGFDDVDGEAGGNEDVGSNPSEDDKIAEQEGLDDWDERSSYSRYESLFKEIEDNDEDDALAGGSGEELSANLWNYDTELQDPFAQDDGDSDGESEARGTSGGQPDSAAVSSSRRFWTDFTSRWKSLDNDDLSQRAPQAVDLSKAVLASIEPLANQRYYQNNNDEDDEDDSTALSTDTDGDGDSSADLTEGQIDERKIPIIAEVAMDAIVDYTAEVLHPTLVIHEISMALQRALQEMRKSRRRQGSHSGSIFTNQRPLYGGNFDSSEDEERDPLRVNDELGSISDTSYDARLAKSDHELDLLGDEWVWNDGDVEDDSEVANEGSRQDEDLWDQEMEVQDWDETGHLFEMDDDEAETSEQDQTSDSTADAQKSEDDEGSMDDSIEQQKQQQQEQKQVWQNDQDDDDDNIEDGSYYPVGIQDDDDEADEDDGDNSDISDNNNSNNLDSDEADQESTPVTNADEDDGDSGSSSTVEETDQENTYLSRGLFDKSEDNDSALYPALQRRFSQKRSDEAAEDLPRAPLASSSPMASQPAAATTRRDPTFESLLTQLIEPILNDFINNEFPASCQRSRGELMDAIIWSLDQKDEDVEADQLALFAELEY